MKQTSTLQTLACWISANPVEQTKIPKTWFQAKVSLCTPHGIWQWRGLCPGVLEIWVRLSTGLAEIQSSESTFVRFAHTYKARANNTSGRKPSSLPGAGGLCHGIFFCFYYILQVLQRCSLCRQRFCFFFSDGVEKSNFNSILVQTNHLDAATFAWNRALYSLNALPWFSKISVIIFMRCHGFSRGRWKPWPYKGGKVLIRASRAL